MNVAAAGNPPDGLLIFLSNRITAQAQSAQAQIAQTAPARTHNLVNSGPTSYHQS